MNRRSTEVSGWVNFPVESPVWYNTKEGGMFVKLVVVDTREFDKQFGICSGAYVSDILSETFVNDDVRPRPDFSRNKKPSLKSLSHAIKLDSARTWEDYHFPDSSEYRSRPYLASIVMGSTGWSGCCAETGRLWFCQYSDLTDNGKNLYSKIEKMFRGCRLHLLTFLDT